MTDAAFESGFAEVNGTRLYFETRGSGDALLFLHGFTLDRRMWTGQLQLCERFRVVTYDARGFGRSALPGESVYRHYEDAAALCEHLGLSRVIAIGHSIGAHQMLDFALMRPALVAGFVSVCMSGLASVPFSQELVKLFAALRLAAKTDGIDAAKRIWGNAGWFAPARRIPALAAELDDMLREYSGWHWTHDNPAKSAVPPAAERLSELVVPALVITGGHDLEHNTRVGQALMQGIRGATALALSHASHMANMEDPESVNRAITALVARSRMR